MAMTIFRIVFAAFIVSFIVPYKHDEVLNPNGIAKEEGFCYTYAVRELPLWGRIFWRAPAREDSNKTLHVILREDDRVLGPSDSMHASVREHGGGRYSLWASSVFFSTSDNHDPRDNGRRYSIEFSYPARKSAFAAMVIVYFGIMGFKSRRTLPQLMATLVKRIRAFTYPS